MILPQELYDSLTKLNRNLEGLLENKILGPTERGLEFFLYLLERRRAEIYEQVRILNRERETEQINIIDNEYKAELIGADDFLHK